MPQSRFAKFEEINTPEFEIINKRLVDLHNEYHLIDHYELNKERFPWLEQLKNSTALLCGTIMGISFRYFISRFAKGYEGG